MKYKTTIINETKTDFPPVFFDEIKNEILGKNYILNVIITTSAKIKKLNAIYRNKETPTDILSFPISKNEGEIYICPSETRKQAKKFDRNYENFCSFLFIHGCTHLKGYDHGAIMERTEEKVRRKFGI